MSAEFPLALLPFVSPWLFAAGAAATSIPIVIHLLNRRRFRIKQWAAMEFLLAAMRRNVRRLKLQRWLLLLLRILAILLLAAAIAQFTPVGAALAPLLGSSSRLTVVVLNNAYPMGYHPHARATPFTRAKKLLAAWLRSGGATSRVAIINASHNAVPMLPSPTYSSALILRQIRQQRVSQAGEDLAGGLQQALALVKKEKNRSRLRTVWVLTDGARNNFYSIDGHNSTLRQRLATLVAKIKQSGAHVRIIDLGYKKAVTLAITQLSPAHPVVLVNQPLAVRFAVFNASSKSRHDVVVRFFLDRTAAGQTVLREILPGKSATGETLLNQKILQTGAHAITAEVATDALPADNIRRMVVTARRNIPVLIADGRPGDPTTRRLASTAWIQAALAPYRHGNTFKPEHIGSLELADQSLKHYRAVILSDLPPPSPRLGKRLKNFVAAGGLLIIYPGPQTNGTQWSDALGAGAKGLLPAAMGAVVRVKRTGSDGSRNAVARTATGTLGFDPARSINPVVATFLAAEKSGIHTGLADVATRQYVVLHLHASAASHTLLYFANGAPALVERRIGLGKVLLWATSADTQWTDFPAQPSFPPFLYQLLFHTLGNPDTSQNILVANSVNLPPNFTAGNWPGPHHRVIAVTRELVANQPRLESPPVRTPGFYGPEGGAPLIAVNVDARWADVRHLPTSRLATLLHIKTSDVLENPTSLARAEPVVAANGGNAGHNLLYLALAVLVAEALAAKAFSHYQLAPAKPT